MKQTDLIVINTEYDGFDECYKYFVRYPEGVRDNYGHEWGINCTSLRSARETAKAAIMAFKRGGGVIEPTR